MTGCPPVKLDVNLFKIVTAMAGVTMVNEKLSLFVESAADVAVMVGEALAVEGGRKEAGTGR